MFLFSSEIIKENHYDQTTSQVSPQLFPAYCPTLMWDDLAWTMDRPMFTTFIVHLPEPWWRGNHLRLFSLRQQNSSAAGANASKLHCRSCRINLNRQMGILIAIRQSQWQGTSREHDTGSRICNCHLDPGFNLAHPLPIRYSSKWSQAFPTVAGLHVTIV